MTPELWIGVIVGTSALSGTVVSLVANRAGRKASVASTVTSMFKDLAEGLRRELEAERSARERLEEKISRFEIANWLLREHNALLTAQVARLGAVPVPMPDERKE